MKQPDIRSTAADNGVTRHAIEIDELLPLPLASAPGPGIVGAQGEHGSELVGKAAQANDAGAGGRRPDPDPRSL